LKAKLEEKDEVIATLRKSVSGFQPSLQEKAIELERVLRERDQMREQLEAARNSEYESPNEGVLATQLRQKGRALMEARARVRALEIVGRYNLPEALRNQIANKPLAHINVPDNATEDTIELDVAEQLPSYLDNLVKELGTGNKNPNPETPAGEEEPKAPPAPRGTTPSGGTTVYADEIDSSKPGGYARYLELKDKIDSGQITVLQSRTRKGK